jgi:uncharacterized DUF497 family protein
MRKTAFSGFEWDEGNRHKCRKHGVSTEEIEHVLAYAEALIRPDPKWARRASWPSAARNGDVIRSWCSHLAGARPRLDCAR